MQKQSPQDLIQKVEIIPHWSKGTNPLNRDPPYLMVPVGEGHGDTKGDTNGELDGSSLASWVASG